MPSSGSCLCGQARFEVDGEFEHFFLCHCEYCRKDTGSAHAACLFSHTARLRWIRGESGTTRFRLPGTRHQKCFCTVCGSALPYVEGGMIAVPAGSLDTPITLRPSAHIFVASRASWDDNLDAAPSFDRFPSLKP